MMMQESVAWVGEAEFRAAAGGVPINDTHMERGGHPEKKVNANAGPSVYRTGPIRFWDQDMTASEDEDDDGNEETGDQTEYVERIVDATDSYGENVPAQQPGAAAGEIETYVDRFRELLNKEVAERLGKRKEAKTQVSERDGQLVDMLGPTEERDSETRERPNLRRLVTSPPRPLEVADGHEAGDRSRGHSRERNPAGDTSSEPSSKRTSMRSFAQKTLRPLTLRTSLRPKSSPVISASDMEKLRSIGEAEEEGTADLPSAESSGAGAEKEQDTRRVRDVLPTIQESPATPRRPVPAVRTRNRPMSLYGALYAMGKKQRAAQAATTAGRSQGHKRSFSEISMPLDNLSESEGPPPRARAPNLEPPGRR